MSDDSDATLIIRRITTPITMVTRGIHRSISAMATIPTTIPVIAITEDITAVVIGITAGITRAVTDSAGTIRVVIIPADTIPAVTAAAADTVPLAVIADDVCKPFRKHYPQ